MARYKAGHHPNKRKRHSWTHEQRLTLHLLHSPSPYYTIAQRVAIFNTIFADELRQSGYSDGMDSGTITSQYSESKKTDRPTCLAIWGPIVAEPEIEEEIDRRSHLSQQIARTAKTLGGGGPTTASNESQPPPARTSGAVDTPLSQFLGSRLQRSNIVELMDTDDEDSPARLPPPPLSRQRKRIAAQEYRWDLHEPHLVDAAAQSDSNGDFVPRQHSALVKRIRTDPQIIIPVTPKRKGPGRPRNEITTPNAGPATPRKTTSSIAIRRAKATEEFTRPNGTIMLTPDELRMTKEPLVPPSEIEAHPPLAGLLLYAHTFDCNIATQLTPDTVDIGPTIVSAS